MKNLTFLLLICLHTPAFTQTLVEKTYSHSLNFGISDIVPTSDNNFLITASAAPTNVDSVMAFVIKVDSLLDIAWVKRYKILRTDDFSSIIALSDGNYLLGGVAKQQFSSIPGSTLLKIDPAGNVIWHKVFSSTPDDRILRIFERSDQSLMVFVRHGVTNQPSKIFHLDNAGNILSKRTYGIGTISNGVFAEKVVSDANENYYLSGTRRDLLTNRYMCFVMAIDETGFLWYRQYDIGRSVTVFGIEVTSTGQLLICGYVLDASASGVVNPWIQKTDLSGNVVWAMEYVRQPATTTYFFGLKEMTGGNILAYGYANPGVDAEGLTVTLDTNGIPLNSTTYNQYKPQSIRFAETLPDGRYLLLGNASGESIVQIVSSNFQSACSTGSISLIPQTLNVLDSAIVPLVADPTVTPNTVTPLVSSSSLTTNTMCIGAVGLTEPTTEYDNSTLYPVPAQEKLFLKINEPSVRVSEFAVYDICGQRIYCPYFFQGDITEFDTSNLNSGLYWISWKSGENYGRKRFVKQ